MANRWVTWRGKHILVDDDGNIVNQEKNVGVHYGDLGKARDTYFWNINSSNRSTGHFGTGTYFISADEEKKLQDSPSFTRKDRPRQEVDFNDYKLYRPKIDSEGQRLHSGLKAINYNDYDSFDFRVMKDDLKRNGISESQINSAIENVEKARNEYISKGYINDYAGKYDSYSTIFMKSLDFDGIDVRGLEGLDNTAYGSVIYDINKKRKK